MPACRYSLQIEPTRSYTVLPECSSTIAPSPVEVLDYPWSPERTESPVPYREPLNEVCEPPQKLYAVQHSCKELYIVCTFSAAEKSP